MLPKSKPILKKIGLLSAEVINNRKEY